MTRFVVMAMLQAARAHSLGLPRDAAYSWGLNRAIFYAAAKRGFRGTPPTEGGAGAGAKERPAPSVYRLGDDEALRDPTSTELRFVIGDEGQTPAEFERSVASRFGPSGNFRAAWDEAVGVVGGFDRAILESRQRFYDEVYKPRRDELSDDWTQRYSPPLRPT
ncbi:MAG: hypothetical protein L3J73_04010 [Thermoplasmata archaeon]|nr:hypothetical protein [Thermoplasmata archaeon]